jgi:hypothetical protein
MVQVFFLKPYFPFFIKRQNAVLVFQERNTLTGSSERQFNMRFTADRFFSDRNRCSISVFKRQNRADTLSPLATSDRRYPTLYP